MWMYFRPHLETVALFFDTMGKSNEISEDIRMRILELQRSGLSFGTILQMFEGAVFICSNNYAQK